MSTLEVYEVTFSCLGYGGECFLTLGDVVQLADESVTDRPLAELTKLGKGNKARTGRGESDKKW